jgi:hypothetical protein
MRSGVDYTDDLVEYNKRAVKEGIRPITPESLRDAMRAGESGNKKLLEYYGNYVPHGKGGKFSNKFSHKFSNKFN